MGDHQARGAQNVHNESKAAAALMAALGGKLPFGHSHAAFSFNRPIFENVTGLAIERPLQWMAAASEVLECSAGTRWLAVGDAALAFDPLSSQGICRSLESGLLGARAIAAALDGHDSALLDWSFQNRQRFASHVQTRQAYYRLERRWPDSEFWRRRHTVTPPVQRDSDYGKNAQSYVVALSSLPHSGPSSGRRSETPPRRPISLSDLPS